MQKFEAKGDKISLEEFSKTLQESQITLSQDTFRALIAHFYVQEDSKILLKPLTLKLKSLQEEQLKAISPIMPKTVEKTADLMQIEEKKEGAVPDGEEEEDMLDVAESCFIRMAQLMLQKQLTIRQVFAPLAIPEQFPDGTVIELLTPIGFLEGVK